MYGRTGVSLVPRQENRPTIAVEFVGIYGEGRGSRNGPVFCPTHWRGLRHLRGMLEALYEYATVIIHTRLVSEDLEALGVDCYHQAAAIRRWLRREGLPFDDVWELPGKPIASRYIESQAEISTLLQELRNGAV